ncbi:hypothetical protein ACFQ4M_15795 [Thauera mechernichensis]|uniref:Uncharacterized protein n=1 Tax=Thauera mechernichensis TaxID=82788 RepID=A0ABW3WJW0_9RHOO|nr:hypothetical protein [Thauera mechernichensis]MDG3063283.1 hypothetical protein [Thauera mechernichensis]
MNDFFDWLHDAAERVLPMVCAFGLGVVIALEAGDTERETLRAAVVSLADQVEHTRIACGAQPDPDAVSAVLAAARMQEVQP